MQSATDLDEVSSDNLSQACCSTEPGSLKLGQQEYVERVSDQYTL